MKLVYKINFPKPGLRMIVGFFPLDNLFCLET